MKRQVDGEHSIVPQQNLLNVSLKELEGARRTEIESKEQSKDKQRQRKKKKTDLPGAIVQVSVWVCWCVRGFGGRGVLGYGCDGV